MMMKDYFVHYHAFPRYDKDINLFDIEWKDNDWTGAIDFNGGVELEEKKLEEIKNYWSLSLGQVVAYAYIIYNNLTFTEREITNEEILSEFVYTMRIYSPDNAIEFVNNQINTRQKLI